MSPSRGLGAVPADVACDPARAAGPHGAAMTPAALPVAAEQGAGRRTLVRALLLALVVAGVLVVQLVLA
ncbi:hypothetical protein AEA42_04775, partial [Shewanella sp. Sh95]